MRNAPLTNLEPKVQGPHSDRRGWGKAMDAYFRIRTKDFKKEIIFITFTPAGSF
jgi:hypothetical protein